MRHESDYVMVQAGSNLDNKLKRWPGFAAVVTPGERYSLYAIDRQRLGGERNPET